MRRGGGGGKEEVEGRGLRRGRGGGERGRGRDEMARAISPPPPPLSFTDDLETSQEGGRKAVRAGKQQQGRDIQKNFLTSNRSGRRKEEAYLHIVQC